METTMPTHPQTPTGIREVFTRALESAEETYIGCRWVLDELVSERSKRYIIIALITLFVASTATVIVVPYMMQFVIDSANTNPEQSKRYLLLLGFVLLIGTVFGSLNEHSRERVWNENFFTVHVGAIRKLCQRTYDEIVADKSEVGPEQLDSLKEKVRNILYLFLFESSIVIATVLGTTTFLFLTHTYAGLLAVALTVFNLVWFFFCNAIIDEKMSLLDEDFRRFSRRVVDKLNMIGNIKAYGTEEKTVAQTGQEIIPVLEEDFKIWGEWFQIVDFWRRVVNNLSPIGILWYGIGAGWSGGTLAAVSGLTFMVTREYGFFGHLMRHLSAQVARIKATREALMQEPRFDYNHGVEFKEHGGLAVEFKDISVTYGNREILRDVSFEIPRGSRTAVVGRSGAGKSTLAKLLFRAAQPASGDIIVTGEEPRSLTEYNLRTFLSRVGVIPQKPELLSGTVHENALLAIHDGGIAEIDEAEIWRVLRALSPSLCHRIEDEGLQTDIGKQGLELSGGQQQLLCVARALLKNPTFLIVDEATSSMDSETEKVVQQGIDAALERNISALVIAHRFATLRNCNQIVVLKRLEDCGPDESQIEAICTSLQEAYDVSPTFRSLAIQQGFRP